MKTQLIMTVVASVFCSVWSYPTYVPEEACRTMLPGHGEAPQKSRAPYQVQVSPQIVRQGDVVQLILSGTQPFKGFYIQARTPDGAPVGTFIRSKDVKTHNCNEGLENAAFHGVRGLKNDLEVFWTAPSDYQGEINFYTTFVAEFDKIWTYVRGNTPVTVKSKLKTKLRTSNFSIFDKLDPNSEKSAVEIVPRIMNRQSSPQIKSKRHRFSALKTNRLMLRPVAASRIKKEKQEIAATFPTVTKYFANFHSMQNDLPENNAYSMGGVPHCQNARPHNTNNANFHSSHAEHQWPLFPMQINHKNSYGLNYHSRNENKINQQRQVSPYQFEYNRGNDASLQPTFSYPSPYQGSTSPMTSKPADVTSGKRSTVWLMGDRFKNFKDVDDLVPQVTRPVPSSIVHQEQPIPWIGDPGMSNAPYVSHASPIFTSTGGDYRQSHQFPTHGYLVKPLKLNGDSLPYNSEAPFYLIPASKHDVDNFHGQYFIQPPHNHGAAVLAEGYNAARRRSP